MQIVWHGHACFSLKGNKATVVTDPYDPEFIGLKLPKLTADIVTISHDHRGHNYFKGVSGAKVFDWPGEYELKEISVVGVPTWHNPKDAEDRGPNTVFAFTIDDIRVCHLGDLGHVLTTDQTDELGGIDILLVPVGGRETIDAKKAKEIIEKVDPKIVIPMHYRLPGIKRELDDLEEFTKVMELPMPVKESVFKLKKSEIPGEEEEMKLVVLDPVVD